MGTAPSVASLPNISISASNRIRVAVEAGLSIICKEPVMRFSPMESPPLTLAFKKDGSCASATRISMFRATLNGPILSLALAWYASTPGSFSGVTFSTPGRRAARRGVSRRSFQTSSGEASTFSSSLIFSSIAAGRPLRPRFVQEATAPIITVRFSSRQKLNCARAASCHNHGLHLRSIFMAQTSSIARAKDGCQLWYRIYANPGKPRLALIHSLALSGAMWGEVIAQLADTAEILAYDCRGHGQSERRPGPYSVELFADDLAALGDSRGWASAVGAGCSAG